MVGQGESFRLCGVIPFALRAIYSIVIPGRASWRRFEASRNDDGVVSETHRSRAGTRVIFAPSAFSRSSMRS
jgi:hypothetical protein